MFYYIKIIIIKDNDLIIFNIIYKNYRYLVISFKLSLILLINNDDNSYFYLAYN